MGCTSFLILVLIIRLFQVQHTFISSPFYSLLYKCIWTLLVAAVKTVLNLVSEKLGGIPDNTVNSCVTLGKSSSFKF